MKAGQLVRLARPPTLVATAVPLMVGGALAWAHGSGFDGLALIDIAVVALLMQVATNAMNEYGDYRHSVDTEPSVGFAGIIVSGEVPAGEVLATAVGCYAVSFVLGVLLVLLRGPLMLALGLIAILVGVAYSEGPLPISSTPFGEVVVGLVMGPIEVISAELAGSGGITMSALAFSVPVAAMVAAVLLANNLRDIVKDKEHGRRTLPVIIGRNAGVWVLLGLFTVPFLWTVLIFALSIAKISVFLVLVALPLAARCFLRLRSGTAWERSVPMVAGLYVVTGLLVTLSILLPI